MSLKGKNKADLQSVCEDKGIAYAADATNAELRDLIEGFNSADNATDTLLEDEAIDAEDEKIVVADASLEAETIDVHTAEIPSEKSEVWKASLFSKGRWLNVDGEFSSSEDASAAAKSRGGHFIKIFIKEEVSDDK